MNINNLKINLGLNMQDYYDDLVLMRKCIDAQIKVLENEPNICKHDVIKTPDNAKFKHCVRCGKAFK